MNFKFLGAALSVLLVAPTANADVLDIYIQAGQSNADGRGNAAELSAGVAAPQSADIWYYTTDAAFRSNGWEPLAPGFSDPPPNFDGNVNFGPEISFAGAVKTATGTSNEVGIVKITEGGTGIGASQEWSPDPNNPGSLYTALFNQVDGALQALQDRGDTGVIRGVIWHQGESNRNLSTYTDVLSDLIDDVRDEYGADLPFVLGELSSERGDNANFNSQLAAFVNDPSTVKVGLVSSVGLTTVNGIVDDDTHFDAASQITLGQRYASVIAPLVTISVPEPSSMGLLMVGALWLGRRRRA